MKFLGVKMTNILVSAAGVWAAWSCPFLSGADPIGSEPESALGPWASGAGTAQKSGSSATLVSTYFLWYYCYNTVLSGNIWQELEPKPKIKNFGSATLDSLQRCFAFQTQSEPKFTKYIIVLELFIWSRNQLPVAGERYLFFFFKLFSKSLSMCLNQV